MNKKKLSRKSRENPERKSVDWRFINAGLLLKLRRFMVISGASLLPKIKEFKKITSVKKIKKLKALNGIRESTAPGTDNIENRLKLFMALGLREIGRIRGIEGYIIYLLKGSLIIYWLLTFLGKYMESITQFAMETHKCFYKYRLKSRNQIEKWPSKSQ